MIEINEKNITRIIIIILVIGMLYLLFKPSNENFADNTLNIDTIRDEINKQYNMDIEAMRNLGAISKSLLTGTNYHSTTVGTPGDLTIPADWTNLMGNLSMYGQIYSRGRMHVNGEEILYILNKKGVIIGKEWGGDGSLSVQGSVNFMPRGCVIMWSGAMNALPYGWCLCDTSHGSPDLRGRFVLGAGAAAANNFNNYGGDSDGAHAGYGGEVYNIGLKSGVQKQTLSVAQMPAHSHNFGRDHWAWIEDTGGVDLGNVNNQRSNDLTGRTNVVGGNQPHNNMPPYYVLVYIMKT
jgi:microcystin-dependent protein